MPLCMWDEILSWDFDSETASWSLGGDVELQLVTRAAPWPQTAPVQLVVAAMSALSTSSLAVHGIAGGGASDPRAERLAVGSTVSSMPERTGSGAVRRYAARPELVLSDRKSFSIRAFCTSPDVAMMPSVESMPVAWARASRTSEGRRTGKCIIL